MKVLICSSEIVPFAKTGGLADVAGALPFALEELGVEVRLVMPKYRTVKTNQQTLGKNIIVYFIENDAYFNRDGLYGTKAGDFPDNLDRFSFFCKEALELVKREGFQPDIIHCNDWQTALIPVYLKSLYAEDPFFKNTKTVFTIHNLAYQGLFPKEELPKTGLPWYLFNMEALEFYGKINLLKGGLVFSDLINTVSSAYAREIQTKEFGAGLEGMLAKRKNSLFGILNGLDYRIWDPATDKFIFKSFSPKALKDKTANKTRLQEACGLKPSASTPLFGIVSRLAEQKGFDLLAGIMKDLCKMPIQIVILGTGDQKYHDLLGKIAKQYPERLSLNLKFDDPLAHQIYAGSDFFLMPSKYEPCGLGQMISLKYATIPIVYKTGGLADTIVDFDLKKKIGNGFVLRKYSQKELLAAIKRALSIYKKKPVWSGLVRHATTYDFSWKSAAANYIKLYNRLL
ncbi:MAG: glycogen/starch synthase [Candidatus Omnitrophota bacterium]